MFLQISENRDAEEVIPSIQPNHTTYDNLKNKITHTEISANFSMKMHTFRLHPIHTYLTKSIWICVYVCFSTYYFFYLSHTQMSIPNC